jgi:hypothetical protein
LNNEINIFQQYHIQLTRTNSCEPTVAVKKEPKTPVVVKKEVHASPKKLAVDSRIQKRSYRSVATEIKEEVDEKPLVGVLYLYALIALLQLFLVWLNE